MRFTPDSKALVYLVRQNGVDNLWEASLQGGAYRQLTHFTSERIQHYLFSRDGSKIAIERAHTDSDAMLLRDLRSKKTIFFQTKLLRMAGGICACRYIRIGLCKVSTPRAHFIAFVIGDFDANSMIFSI